MTLVRHATSRFSGPDPPSRDAGTGVRRVDISGLECDLPFIMGFHQNFRFTLTAGRWDRDGTFGGPVTPQAEVHRPTPTRTPTAGLTGAFHEEESLHDDPCRRRRTGKDRGRTGPGPGSEGRTVWEPSGAERNKSHLSVTRLFNDTDSGLYDYDGTPGSLRGGGPLPKSPPKAQTSGSGVDVGVGRRDRPTQKGRGLKPLVGILSSLHRS